VREDLERGGAALATVGPEIVGCLRFELAEGYLHVRRVAVDPAWQGRGIGRALMRWAHDFARHAGVPEVRVGVRLQLPGNRRFYERLGYTVLAEHRHPGYRDITWIEMILQL
jgi:GNAT superfamily N-acetyltransferase